MVDFDMHQGEDALNEKAKCGVHLEDFDVQSKLKLLIQQDAQAPFEMHKLVVLGEGRSGKSSTIRSLLKEKIVDKQTSSKGFDIETIHAYDWKELKHRPIIQHFRNLILSKRNSLHLVNNSKERDKLQKIDEKRKIEQKQPVSIKESRKERVIPQHVDGNEILQYCKEINALENSTSGLGLAIWDFGGQEVFYTLHHIFLTSLACYLIVFNMVDILEKTKVLQTITYLKFWLNSVKLQAPKSRIIIVGTHCDRINENILSDIDTILFENIFKHNIYNRDSNGRLSFFPVSNTDGKGIAKLKMQIEESVSKLDEGATVPVSYLRFLDLIMNENKAFLYHENLKEFELGFSEQDFELALKFLTIRGMITYFPQPKYFANSKDLENIIIVYPQWLINGLTAIMFDKERHLEPEVKGHFTEQLLNFKNTRIISQDLLTDIWVNLEFSPKQQVFIKNLMIESALIYEYRFLKDHNNPNPNLYLVTSLTGSNYMLQHTKDIKGHFFVFDFSGNYERNVDPNVDKKAVKFLPVGLLERLICLSIEVSGTFPNSVAPKITDETTLVSFGEDAVIEFCFGIDDDGQQVHIVVKGDNDTSFECFAKKVLPSLSDLKKYLNPAFFSKLETEPHLFVELLIPSSGETEYKLASYDHIKELFSENSDESKQFYLQPGSPTNTKRMNLSAYKHWFNHNDNF